MARWPILSLGLVLLLLAGGCRPSACGSMDRDDPGYCDAWITDQVRQRLDWDCHLSDCSIHVATMDQIVYLQGNVPCERLRRHAAERAAQVKYVFKVNNNIRAACEGPRG